MTNPIGWCDITANPITGCKMGCEYCYAARMAKRQAGRNGYPRDETFRPTFHPDKVASISNLAGKGKRVFLDSMGDWFSFGVESEWIEATVEAVRSKPEHNFLVLTKFPQRVNLLMDSFPKNLWLGVSVTTKIDTWRIQALRVLPAAHKFVSFEPLHGPIIPDLEGIDWIIIGAETGNRRGKVLPELEWIIDLVEAAETADIPVFIKDNVGEETAFVFGSTMQPFPEDLR